MGTVIIGVLSTRESPRGVTAPRVQAFGLSGSVRTELTRSSMDILNM